MDLRSELCGVGLQNPLVLASGPLSWNARKYFYVSPLLARRSSLSFAPLAEVPFVSSNEFLPLRLDRRFNKTRNC